MVDERFRFKGIYFKPLLVLLAVGMVYWSHKDVYADKNHSGNKERQEYNHIINYIEERISGYRQGQNVFIPNCRLKSIHIFLTGLKDFPDCAALYIMSFPENIVKGKKIYFVEPDTEVVQFLKRRKKARIADLLYAKDDQVLSPSSSLQY